MQERVQTVSIQVCTATVSSEGGRAQGKRGSGERAASSGFMYAGTEEWSKPFLVACSFQLLANYGSAVVCSHQTMIEGSIQ